jgi:predicted nucleic acid-binding protein
MGLVDMKLLIDLNIVLDVLQKREPHLPHSRSIWRAVETGQVEGFLAAHSITTLFYLTAKQLGPQKATLVVQQVVNVFAVAAVDHGVVEQALILGWRDFEDAVQMAAAMAANLDYVVTRNRKDYITQPIPVLEPAECVALLAQQ